MLRKIWVFLDVTPLRLVSIYRCFTWVSASVFAVQNKKKKELINSLYWGRTPLRKVGRFLPDDAAQFKKIFQINSVDVNKICTSYLAIYQYWDKPFVRHMIQFVCTVWLLYDRWEPNKISARLNLFRRAFLTQTVASLCLCHVKMNGMIRQIFWKRGWKNNERIFWESRHYSVQAPHASLFLSRTSVKTRKWIFYQFC
jgi:hypothetical protein